MKTLEKIDLNHKFKILHSVWDPRIAAQFNGHQIKLVKCVGPGDFITHDEDVLYLVFKGDLIVAFKEQKFELSPGEFIVVPKGTPCKLASLRWAEVVIFDPAGSITPGRLAADRSTTLKKI